ncbi:tetratricopeptide repeat protein [Flavilitoribacter nigricans]|uniref:tetratricopeptide repeat protein n=1 Tax=Flavilitoribacter nigricans TaxID=70997 RepID=UPI001472C463|nr:tetratricopeptide repeat protein [Flavilitoribacter nigricans]
MIFIALLWITIGDAGAQSDRDTLPDFQQDRIVLEAGLKDSLGFAKIIDRIRATRSEPRLSLRYITFFEMMDRRYPDIPKDRLSVAHLKADRYNELAWSNNQTNLELALQQLDTADRIAHELNYERGIWRNEFGRGVAYRNSGDSEKALTYFQNFLEHYSEPFDSANVANSQFQIGVCLLNLGKLEESIQALTVAAEIDDQLDRPNYAYNSLGIAYRRAKLYDKAATAYRKAYQHWKTREYIVGQSRALMNLGNLLMETGQIEEAKPYLLRAVALDQGNDYALGYSTENLGNWYLEAGRYDSAYHHLRQSYEIRKTFDNPRQLAIVEHQLARVYMARDQYDQALPLLLNAYETAKAQGEQERIRDVASDLSKWYADQNDFRKALQYKNEFVIAKDSLLNENIAQAVAEVSEKYETEQKERTIEQLNTQNRLQGNLLRARQRQLLLVSIGSLLLAGLLFGIYRLYRRIKLQNRLIQKNLREKETLLKEIHHRVKNNLQIIASLLRIQSRSVTDSKAREAIRESRSRVRSMALIHEDLYRDNDLSGVFMPEYLGKLARDIFRIYNITADRIQLQTSIAPLRLDVDTVIPIGLIVNELITNAFKHAFAERQEGIIELLLEERDEQLILMVRDDGRGFQEKGSPESYGLSMIETFREKLEGDLRIESEKGTTFRLTIRNYRKLENMML